MREAMQEKEQAPSGNNSEPDVNQSFTNAEIQALKSELENVKSKMTELHNDYSELQREYEKLSDSKPKNASGWGFNWRKIKQSFHVKLEGEETEERQDKSKSPFPNRLRANSKRRLSMS